MFPGQALGGATFLGLARALTSATTFDEALALAAEGEAANVDTLVEDIYGSTGCVDLGLPPSLTAASFGKLSRADLRSTSDADVCRALLEMVAQSCCVLARAHAAQLGCRQRVFFAGGFVDENPLARATIANSCAETKSSTRLQCERMRPFRREVFCCASRTRRKQSIRPKISRIDVDATARERLDVSRG